ncbi:creatininase family protein [Saccharopolyspora karakumensis]|uniref:Creatininase family protein n=1 Tax=Saccharopolyspora karakumensis TaxID=2530386 RepID=A0A4V2YXV3_9PSEU|nr:creatininase family protein [Saccharopolyspora karakumensis]TDD90847.1 creatininase family protein [Saccharopolyspora karakumensis]
MLVRDTTDDVRDRGAEVAVLPIGSLEQHGSHLPLVTDTVIACTIAREVAAAHPVQLLSPVTISCSQEHAAWPGTVSISARTLHLVVTDVFESLRRSGVPKLVLINGHGGNYVLSNVVQEAGGDMALFPAAHDWDEARVAAGVETPARSDMHAGEVETSILLHAHPDLVRPGYETGDHLADDRRHLLTTGLPRYSESGVIGSPSLGSAGKGRDLLAGLAAAFGDHLAALG